MNCFGFTDGLQAFYVYGSYNPSSKNILKVFASDVFVFFFFLFLKEGMLVIPSSQRHF
jgi:hypothetical protein